MTGHHLAQINIAKARDELDSPRMDGFVSRLDEINALAEKAPGFIWRLQTDDGDATSLRVFEDPLLIINMSVWKDVESLKDFVYRSVHVELLKNRAEWFDRIQGAYQALWWIAAGSLPTIEQGRQKLEMVEQAGANPDAFTLSRIFPPG